MLGPIVLALAALTSVPARADSYVFNLDHCTGTCGGATGSVIVTQNGVNTVNISVTGNFQYVNSTSRGDNFLFNIGAVPGGNINNPLITFSNFTSGWRANQTNALFTQNAGSPGGGGWTFEYSVTCRFTGGACPGNGGSTPAPAALSFDVTAAGLTAASFAFPGGGTAAIFAADVIGPNGNTGLIGATAASNVNVTPEPTSLVLLATVVLGIGATRRKWFQDAA